MVDEKIIDEAIEMTKDIPWSDVLTPLQQNDVLPSWPKTEYKIIEATSMDKLVRDVNNHMSNGWYCDGGVQVVTSSIWTKFYQALERYVATEEEYDNEEN